MSYLSITGLIVKQNLDYYRGYLINKKKTVLQKRDSFTQQSAHVGGSWLKIIPSQSCSNNQYTKFNYRSIWHEATLMLSLHVKANYVLWKPIYLLLVVIPKSFNLYIFKKTNIEQIWISFSINTLEKERWKEPYNNFKFFQK